MSSSQEKGEEITFARPEYAALANEFGFLAAEFGYVIQPALRRDIARLASAIERIDRKVDEATDDDERQLRWQEVVVRLEEIPPIAPARPPTPPRKDSCRCGELLAAAEDLRALAIERDVLDRVRRIVREEARTSEAIRRATTLRSFVQVVEREGRLTAALALAIAGSACGGRTFRRFFFRLAAPANLVDKLLDARADHARGEIALVPGVVLYAGLACALVRRCVMLLFTCAKPVLIARLALRYLGPARAH